MSYIAGMAKTAKKLRGSNGAAAADLMSPADVAAFEAAAAAYTRKATRTKRQAIATLQREGILTKRGQIARAFAKS